MRDLSPLIVLSAKKKKGKEMETCDFCDFFGDKKHCYNCRVKNLSDIRERAPKPITLSLRAFIEFVHTHTCEEIMQVYGYGDWLPIKLGNAVTANLVIVGFEHDEAEDGTNPKVTLCIVGIPYLARMNERANNEFIPYVNTEMNKNTLPLILHLLPSQLKSNIIPVKKITCGIDDVDESYLPIWLFSESELCPDPVRNGCAKKDEGHLYPAFEFGKMFNRFEVFGQKSYFLRSVANSVGFAAVLPSGSTTYTSRALYEGILVGLCV